jgi:hypothetical protein
LKHCGGHNGGHRDTSDEAALSGPEPCPDDEYPLCRVPESAANSVPPNRDTPGFGGRVWSDVFVTEAGEKCVAVDRRQFVDALKHLFQCKSPFDMARRVVSGRRHTCLVERSEARTGADVRNMQIAGHRRRPRIKILGVHVSGLGLQNAERHFLHDVVRD